MCFAYELIKNITRNNAFLSGEYRIEITKCIDKYIRGDGSETTEDYYIVLCDDNDKTYKHITSSKKEYDAVNKGAMYYAFIKNNSDKKFLVYECNKYSLSEELKEKLMLTESEWAEKEAKWEAEIKEMH